ncbi:F-box/kelch-repeat protein SKIP4 [Prunus yedoensis var. nudiflora]|uniref:F-box/kelch-repeat protein SKIP4 n=1 Tax=Prunus yedoensis var. nudiflora TaxID=2094558 RepID=A0A314UGB8_PRUYE|nr:F-box/kelch-repeat protein SKIP4 [Prunus yedoensis var. nudiflora]
MQKCQKVGLDSPYRLLYCSSKGDKAGVMHELEKGVKPNLADYDKRTALHLASCEGCTEIVDLLLHKGADVNSTDRWGRTPLSDARSFSQEAVCKILEARGGIDPLFHFPNAFTHVGLDSQLPCYEIEHTEVNMDEATLIGESLCLIGFVHAGGLGSNSSDPHSWDIYDPCTNSWKFHSDPNIVPEIEDSVVMDGKIYIRCGTSAVTSHVYAVVYEPSSGTWQHADADMVAGWRGPAVVVDGTLYVLDQSSGTRLMMWQKESRVWIPVGRLSYLAHQAALSTCSYWEEILRCRKGLSTVMFDVENAGNMEGVMVSSSIPKLNSDDDVISCKCLSI